MTTTIVPKAPVKKISLARTLRENRVVQGLFLIFPANLYLFLLIVLPLLLVAGLSFLSRGEYGQVVFKFDPSNYTRLFDALYGKIMLFSLVVGVGTTGLCLLIGYPDGILPGTRAGPPKVPVALPNPAAILDEFHHPDLCLDDDPALGGFS